MLKPSMTSSTEYSTLGLGNDRSKQDMPHDYYHRLSCQGLRDRDVSDLAHQPKHKARHQNAFQKRDPIERRM
jgi:hypothetical protein